MVAGRGQGNYSQVALGPSWKISIFNRPSQQQIAEAMKKATAMPVAIFHAAIVAIHRMIATIAATSPISSNSGHQLFLPLPGMISPPLTIFTLLTPHHRSNQWPRLLLVLNRPTGNFVLQEVKVTPPALYSSNDLPIPLERDEFTI